MPLKRKTQASESGSEEHTYKKSRSSAVSIMELQVTAGYKQDHPLLK